MTKKSTSSDSTSSLTNRLCSPASLAAIAILHRNSHQKIKKKVQHHVFTSSISTTVMTDKSKQKEKNVLQMTAKISKEKPQVTVMSEKQQATLELLQNYKEIYTMVKGSFLVPANYPGHEHKWIQLDAGLCICEVCGAEHICFQGECPTIQMEQSESVCSISGCVIVRSEMKAEWGALERVHSPASTSTTFGKGRSSSTSSIASSQPHVKHKKEIMMINGNHKNKKRKTSSTEHNEQNESMHKKKQKNMEKEIISTSTSTTSDRTAHLRPSMLDPIMYAQQQHWANSTASRITSLHSKRTNTIHDTVETVVREILDSPKTARCLEEEMARDNARRLSCLAKLIRELVSNHHNCRERPNMLHLEAKLSWHCNKCRRITTITKEEKSTSSNSRRYYEEVISTDLSFKQKKIHQQLPQPLLKEEISRLPSSSSTTTTTLFMCICTQESNSSSSSSSPLSSCSVCNNDKTIISSNSSTSSLDFTEVISDISEKMEENDEMISEGNNEEGDEMYHQHDTEYQSNNKQVVLQRVIRLCVDNICNLIQTYGWHRVDRQLQHASRGREFICSMLYLMRMGITFKNQTILQKMEILNNLLPLQVFLPTIFNIRAKSITEGENIIKLDLQHIPL